MQNFMKTIINAVQSWTKKEIKEEIGKIPVVSPDWNENDKNSNNYIKNKPFYSEQIDTVVLDTSFTFSGSGLTFNVGAGNGIVYGGQYTMYFDGVEYSCIAEDVDGYCEIYPPDGSFYFGSWGDDAIDFHSYNVANGTHTVKLIYHNQFVKQIDEKYIPDSIATLEEMQNSDNKKMNKSNPVGTGSFSMNRKSGTSTGTLSVALGCNTTASGSYSYAEGYNTQATTSSAASTSTTTSTTAGYVAHAEGYGTVACGTVSHAEGNGTKASGQSSHAEGYSTKASGGYSHAEGHSTTASGSYSHAEGHSTIAQRSAQHTQGEYNILDTEGTIGTRGKYAHIVGNGTSDTARSNAHTLDWNGVGWYQGGLQVGGNAQDDGAKNVLLDGDAVKLVNAPITLPNFGTWGDVTYGNGKFVAVSNAGNGSVGAAYSEDGITWTETTLPASVRWSSVTYGDGKFVAVAYTGDGSNHAAYSEDGISWTETTLPASVKWQSVAYGNGKFVAVNDSNIAAYSEDGITWTEITLPASVEWSSVTYGNGKFVAIARGSKTDISSIASYSEDGISWIQTTLPKGDFWNSVTYGNGKFVAITNDSYAAAYSEDGITWIETTLPINSLWCSVAYGNGKFVAVGGIDTSGTVIAYSEDGITWAATHLPEDVYIGYVAYGNGKFVGVANSGGKAVYSEDGITWYRNAGTLLQDNENVTNYIKDRLLKGNFIPTPFTATVGQVLSVKAVDESGKPTEWEVVDMSSGVSSSEFILNSSTEGSTKQFSITIDDTGTLTVSEIVAEEAE